jgi:hypothetical protein
MEGNRKWGCRKEASWKFDLNQSPSRTFVNHFLEQDINNFVRGSPFAFLVRQLLIYTAPNRRDITSDKARLRKDEQLSRFRVHDGRMREGPGNVGLKK